VPLPNATYIIQETVPNEQAKGISISSITAFGLELRSSGQGTVPPVVILLIETADEKIHTFSGQAATRIYKELKKLAIVV